MEMVSASEQLFRGILLLVATLIRVYFCNILRRLLENHAGFGSRSSCSINAHCFAAWFQYRLYVCCLCLDDD